MLDDDSRWAGGKVPVLDERRRGVAERAAEAYRAMPLETDDGTIASLMGKLAIVFPNHRLRLEEAKARQEYYAEHLRDIPQDLLDQAVTEWMRTSEFFPKIADLRNLAYRLPRPARYRRQSRLALLLAAADTRALPAPAADLVDPGEVAAFLSGFGVDPADEERRGFPGMPTGEQVRREPPRWPTEADMIGLMGETAYRASQAAAVEQGQGRVGG